MLPVLSNVLLNYYHRVRITRQLCLFKQRQHIDDKQIERDCLGHGRFLAEVDADEELSDNRSKARPDIDAVAVQEEGLDSVCGQCLDEELPGRCTRGEQCAKYGNPVPNRSAYHSTRSKADRGQELPCKPNAQLICEE